MSSAPKSGLIIDPPPVRGFARALGGAGSDNVTQGPTRAVARRMSTVAARGAVLLLTLACAACARGAPSLVLFGAYFPFWLLCMVIGVVAAIAASLLLARLGVLGRLPYPTVVCAALGVTAGILAGVLWFGL